MEFIDFSRGIVYTIGNYLSEYETAGNWKTNNQNFGVLQLSDMEQ